MSAFVRTSGRRVLIVSMLLIAMYLPLAYAVFDGAEVPVASAPASDAAGETLFSAAAGETFLLASARREDQAIERVLGVLSVEGVTVLVAILILVAASWYGRERDVSNWPRPDYED